MKGRRETGRENKEKGSGEGREGGREGERIVHLLFRRSVSLSMTV